MLRGFQSSQPRRQIIGPSRENCVCSKSWQMHPSPILRLSSTYSPQECGRRLFSMLSCYSLIVLAFLVPHAALWPADPSLDKSYTSKGALQDSHTTTSNFDRAEGLAEYQKRLTRRSARFEPPPSRLHRRINCLSCPGGAWPQSPASHERDRARPNINRSGQQDDAVGDQLAPTLRAGLSIP